MESKGVRRIESVLASLPPRPQWVYGHKPSENTEMSKSPEIFQTKRGLDIECG